MQSSPLVLFGARREVCALRQSYFVCVFIIVLQSTRRSCYSNDLTCVRAAGVPASIEIQSSLFDGREEKGVVCFWRRKKMPERSRRRHRPARSPTRWQTEPWPGRQATRLTSLYTASNFQSSFYWVEFHWICFAVLIFCKGLIGKNAFERPVVWVV